MLVGRQNKCFYGTHIKTECSIPYVITRFDEDHLDRMLHSVLPVPIICTLLEILLRRPKNLAFDETFVKSICLMRGFHDVDHNLQIPWLVL